jgi:methylase of polypeptide subunit release factors
MFKDMNGVSLLKEGTIVLDAGCGSGYGTHFLAKNAKIKAIVGIDISPRAISFANKHFRTNISVYSCRWMLPN